MYQSTAALGATTSTLALAATGFSLLWFLLAAFTLISAGFALLRLMPRATTNLA